MGPFPFVGGCDAGVGIGPLVGECGAGAASDGVAAAIIAELNPIVKGWAAYYRGVVSKKTFSGVQHQHL
jgi:hypothetical protein